MHRSVVSKLTESQNHPEGLVTSFLEISLRVPDSVGQGGAGQGEVRQTGLDGYFSVVLTRSWVTLGFWAKGHSLMAGVLANMDYPPDYTLIKFLKMPRAVAEKHLQTHLCRCFPRRMALNVGGAIPWAELKWGRRKG